MKKKVLIAIIFLFLTITIINIVNVVYDLYTKGYSLSSHTFKSTPEEALAQRADSTLETLHTLTPETVLNTVYIDDIVQMTFVSISDTLVTVCFVTNEKGQYSVYGYTEEVWLSSPSMFVLTGDPENFNFDSEKFIFIPYNQHNTTVYGWCYSGYQFTVNGIMPSKQTFVFDCEGKTWSLDYWKIDNFPAETEVLIEYIEQ